MRNPALLAELNTFEEKKTSLKEGLIGVDSEFRRIDTEINDMKLPEKEKIRGLIKQHNKELEDFEKEIGLLNQEIETDTSDLMEKERQSIALIDSTIRR